MRLTDSQFNRLRVLRELHRREPVSRTELSAHTGLTPATISGIVGDLVERGLVAEERIKPSGMGRPRLNLRLRAQANYTLCAAVMAEGLRLGIIDLRGGIVHSELVAVERTRSVSELIRQICVHLHRTLAETGIAVDQVLRLAIGLPAVVEWRSGVVHYFETFDPGPVDAGAIVAAEMGIPGTIDNTMSLLAAGEHWYGNDAAADSFVLLQIDLGLSSAVYRDGVLHCGRHGMEPEIGHTKVMALGGRPCRCGAHGCVEAYATMSAILDQIEGLAGYDRKSPLALAARFEQLAFTAGVPTPVAAPLLAQAGSVLGTTVANIINVDDPERVVLLVPGPAFAAAIEPAFTAALARDTWPTMRGRVEVVVKQSDTDMILRGAAALTMERLFDSR